MTALFAALLALSPLHAQPLLSPEQGQALDGGIQEYKDGEKERTCRRNVAALVDTLNALAYTCTARCSKENLWLGFAGASGPTAQAAYDAVANRCERSGMHVVNKTLSCLNNYWAASFHEDLDADCEKRRGAMDAELSAKRLSCTAKLDDGGAAPLLATTTAANAMTAYAAFAEIVGSRGWSFRSFAPATDCSWLP